MLPNQLHSEILEAGCDEAGRGCLAGPVVAAAVILPANFSNKDLNDSKQIGLKKRFELKEIIEKEALHWAIGICTPAEIDKINILNASILAMHKALDGLDIMPEFIIVDGNRFKKYKQIPHQTIVKGDGKYANIAAASILAKTHRDLLMHQLHEKFPKYGWDHNMGYPTEEHRAAIGTHGITIHHRKTFRLQKEQLHLF